ncbi:hypothetical protein L4C36_06045 [Photobacterium japonica]|uniref:hypothetical protein n=1 Tax=Photobacterium japonica TaxID=2910235 RepID=UPI003D13646E
MALALGAVWFLIAQPAVFYPVFHVLNENLTIRTHYRAPVQRFTVKSNHRFSRIQFTLLTNWTISLYVHSGDIIHRALTLPLI